MANTRTAFLAVATLFLGTSEGTNQLRGTDTQGISVKIDDNGTRLFARYSDSQGRRLVQKCAKAIVNDDDDTDFTIFQADSECLDVLKASSIILSVEEDHPVHAFGDVALGPHRRLDEQVPWGIAAIQADQLDVGEHRVTVCIVDSGIAIGHPDFVADRLTGKDRTDKDWQWDKDRAGHGTHVAGTIAAAAGNGYGVRGVGMFDLVIVRALSDDISGYESDIYMAVKQCIDMGADVINMSLGSTLISDFASEIYTLAVEEHDIILVAAAGNNGDQTKNFPASHPSVISVGATDESGKRFFSSVNNDQVELVAPGHDILSASVTTHALKTDTDAFGAVRLAGTPDEARRGKLVSCDINSDECSNLEEGGICLFDAGAASSGRTSLEEALANCDSLGGVGAVFFNNDKGLNKIETLFIPDGAIPAICISKGSALALIEKLDESGGFEVTIGDEGDDNVEYIFEFMSGTSMASPHVAASAALLKSHFYGCTGHQIRYAMAYTAHHPDDGCDDEYGYGMIKVKDAYDWLKNKGGCQGWDVEDISRGGCTTINTADGGAER